MATPRNNTSPDLAYASPDLPSLCPLFCQSPSLLLRPVQPNVTGKGLGALIDAVKRCTGASPFLRGNHASLDLLAPRAATIELRPPLRSFTTQHFKCCMLGQSSLGQGSLHNKTATSASLRLIQPAPLSVALLNILAYSSCMVVYFLNHKFIL